ncbi:flagellar protein MotY [Nitrincola iocasae]|uniref:OmpA family protein n=1 Tax=Nitrincola iocasae TaxID=2614693 RepID=A0A5J6LBI4_9GAMM|nr:OmpA family protein [Nitrincola iocasae]QEW05830.1 OmpA family protein [Nitrincola iocasae]
MPGRALLFLLLCLPFQALQAVTFMAPVDAVQWDIEASPFVCRLSQSIPAFGDAVFEQEAGEGLQFLLQPAQTQQLSGRARLVAQAAPWSPGHAPRFIGEMDVSQGQIQVLGKQATQMLAALHEGLMPTFSADRWFGASEAVSVGIMSVNFHSAYQDYLGCLTGLLPVNYRQIARTAVLFPTAEHQLSDATRERLDLIAQYVLTDDTVQQIFVDGHTDNNGRRLLLRDLSKRRAEEVTRYLVSRGVSEDAIITRFHGDRYPVVANDTPENRTRNRRVTIRLEKD